MGPIITVSSPPYFITLWLSYTAFIYIVTETIYPQKRLKITLLDAFCVLIYFLVKYLQFPPAICLLLPVVAIVLTFLEKKTQRFRFISSAMLPLIFLVLTGTIAGGTQFLLLGESFQAYYGDLEADQDYLLIYCIIFPILIVSALFYNGLVRLVHRKERKESKYIFFLWMPVTHILLILLFLVILNQIPSEQKHLTKWLLIAVIVTTIFDLITYVVIDKIELVELQNQKYAEEILKNRLDYQEAVAVNQSKAELRKIRHDMNNILLTVKSLIQLGNTEEAVSLLNKTTQDLSTVDGIPLCSNSTLNAMLSLKKQQCQKAGVTLHTDISESAAMQTDSYDICRLSGNLIDNALEAVLQTASRTIEFRLETDNTSVVITTQNAFDAAGQKKAVRREERGNGSRILREIAKKYNGTYSAYAADEQYFSSVTLQNQKI